ncbi:cation diffusion facilitator family transporter [Aquihabitans daechungensis]|uniref:cation diffusion facilitator family transporter n=1 Tax=Aquihabitans daechungensis TaxID=1052257 RepID=UPI003B9DF359
MSGEHGGHDHGPVDGDHAGSGHGSGGGHAHSHASIRSGERHKGRLFAAFCVLAALMVVEMAAGIITGSLALLSDAGHMLTDVLGLGMALAAIQLASRGSKRSQNTFGLYRLEILAALANSVLLFGVAFYVLYEAFARIGEDVEIDAGPVLVVAVAGLIANLVAFTLLREGAKESLNVEGAYVEVLADTLGSVGVIIGAIVISITGWTWVDPVIGVAIGVWILPRTWKLGSQALRILVQAAPPDLDIEAITADLGAVPGVVDVHDLHAWTLTSDMEVVSAHLMITTDTDPHGVLDQARAVLRDTYGVDHATLQVEPDDHQGCSEITW